MTTLETRTIPETVARLNNKVQGYAALFDAETTIAYDESRSFIEVIRPQAFARTLKKNKDIRCLYNHDRNLVLGRTKSGTLAIREDEKGLWFECTLPDTQAGKDLAVSLERGDIDGCSFGFQVKKDQWSERDGLPVREVLDVDLVEISPCVFPAYQAAKINLRSELKLWRLEIDALRKKLEEIDR